MSAEKGTHDETNGTQLMKTTTNAINFSLPRDSYRRQFELKIFDEFEQYKLFFFFKKISFSILRFNGDDAKQFAPLALFVSHILWLM